MLVLKEIVTSAVMWWWSDRRLHISVSIVIKKIMIVVGYWCYKCGVMNRKEKKRIINILNL